MNSVQEDPGGSCRAEVGGPREEEEEEEESGKAEVREAAERNQQVTEPLSLPPCTLSSLLSLTCPFAFPHRALANAIIGAKGKGKKPPKKAMEDDMDDFSLTVQRYRPEELDKLAKTTKFTRKEIQLIYRGFKQECPTGMVDEDGFKDIFAQFFPQGDASQYAHYVFNTFKRNNHGQISFQDFLGALSTVSRGTTQEKLQWIFGLYDVNNDGLITKGEMLDVVTAIYEMLGRSTEPQVEDSSARDHVEKIFHLIDTNKDGAITIEELAEWVSRDETIVQSLAMMDTVLYTRRDPPPHAHHAHAHAHPHHAAPPTRPSLSQP